MSIIEKAADRIGQLGRRGREATPAHEEPHEADTDLIGRAMRSGEPAIGLIEGRHAAERVEPRLPTGLPAGFAAAPAPAPAPVAEPAPPREIWKIDIERLRRLNMITPDSERNPIAENFRRIKRQVLANIDTAPEGLAPGAPRNLIMVTSALPREGKTFCSINLALSLALELDRTVLLVDADVARPSVLKTLGFETRQKGLMDVLRDRRIDLSEVLHRTDLGKLSILPAGTRQLHATELLASDAMRSLLQEMARRYHDRVIVFDSPPLLAASEASALATQMSQIILVAAAGETTESTLKTAISRIESCPVVNLVLNKGGAHGTSYGYGGYGYGGYGYGAEGA